MRFRLAALILDGKDSPPPVTPVEPDGTGVARLRTMEFHNLGLARKSEPKTVNAESPRNYQVRSRLRGGFVDTLMQHAAFLGEPVLFPLLLDMNQRPLPLAEQQVLESGKRQKGQNMSYRGYARVTL